MSGGKLTEHPSPDRAKVGRLEMFLALWGGPLAWYIQLNLNYALTATPCFPGSERNIVVPANSEWTYVAALVAYAALLIASLASGFLSYTLFRRVGGEAAGSRANVEEAGTGRTRFLVYWGMLMGFGFALVIMVNFVAFMAVPQCAL